jgi:hypothetical protein
VGAPQSADHADVSLQQAPYGSVLELVSTIDAEAESLFLFASHIGLNFPERLKRLGQRGQQLACNRGSEHSVFRIGSQEDGRVIKITHPGKFGRHEHTPQMYLRRWSLLNRLDPTIDAKLEDCVKDPATGQISIVMSMAAFHGSHSSPEETDDFVRAQLGFVPLHDASSTLDYISSNGEIIIRDCHARW